MLAWKTGMIVGVAPLVILAALSGCARFDKFGDDSVNYYEQHPIKNKVETRTYTSDVALAPTSKLAEQNVGTLRTQFHGISMDAVQSVTVGLSKRDAADEARKVAIAKLLRHVGYNKGNASFMTDENVPDSHARIVLSYAAIVLPDCPDWSASPVTTYSNTWQGNFHCSQEVNTGLMVADPHDLAEGTGDVGMTTTRAALAVQNYNNSVTAAATTIGTGSSTAAVSSGSSASATQSSSGGTSQ